MTWQHLLRRKSIQLWYRFIAPYLRRSYSLCYPYHYKTYSPWFEHSFLTFYHQIEPYTVVTADRCYTLQQFARHALNLDGDYAECGVYKGGTARLIAHTIQGHNRSLHLFDTFGGMPEAAEHDPSGHRTGDFGDTSLAAVQRLLMDIHSPLFHPGVIPETFVSVQSHSFCFVHVDVDLYQSVLDCCEFFYDRMSRGGILIFDDYGFPMYEKSAKRAVDEFFDCRPEVPVVLRTGQCLVLKL